MQNVNISKQAQGVELTGVQGASGILTGLYADASKHRMRVVGSNAYKQKHKELGLCRHCSEVVYRDSAFCLKHLRGQNKSTARWYAKNNKRYSIIVKNQREKYRANHQCPSCSAPLDPDADEGRVACMNCRSKGQTYNERAIYGKVIV